MHTTALLRAATALSAICALNADHHIFMVPANAIETLRERQAELVASTKALIEGADEAGRDLDDEEYEQIKENKAEIDKVARQIEARETIAPVAAGTHRKTKPNDDGTANADGTRRVAATARRPDPKAGFENFGTFAQAVRAVEINRASDSQRNLIQNAQTTFGSEGVGADGGFAVPPDFSQTIWQKVMAEDNLLSRCDGLVTGGNSLTYPKDEVAPWDTANGIQVYWEGEGTAPGASKPALQLATTRLSKLIGLVPVSEELLADAPGLQSWLTSKAPQKMTSKCNTAIVRGSGVGQPLGILNAPSFISVAKQSGQQAATLLYGNISDMWGRMYGPCRARAVWIINQDTETQLQQMPFSQASVIPVPVYLPANGAAGTPYATLMGRPVVPVEACSTLGTQGDIMLVDFTQYMALTKGTDIRTDVSMHLYFDQDLMAFRFTFRVNGQPHWGSSITPENGTMTRSWAVGLDTRS